MTNLPHVLVLGGGPAGVGAAFRLRALERARVTVIERGTCVGGNAASFELNGQHVDFGSHRLHPACDPGILADIRRLLGDDLLDRPRHGRILLRGRWLHFPLKPFDLLTQLDAAFMAGAARDSALRVLRRPDTDADADSFADALAARLGPTICESFYFPYARKIWGREPDELAAEQAQRRVAANSPAKLLRKVLALVPGMRAPGAGRFYYPRRGFGQISQAIADAAAANGAELMLGWTVRRLDAPASDAQPWTVTAERDGERRELSAEHVWSTIPLTLLAQMIRPAVPAGVLKAASALEFRAMLLVYLEMPVDRFSEYDAHYFPGEDVTLTRLTEPKVYADLSEPAGRTTLCAELPCSTEDALWRAGDDELGRLVMDDIRRAGLPADRQPLSVHVRRLRHAYPIYTRDFAEPFHELDQAIGALPRLLSFGRQGLFAHDNTHHALAMAYAAADCLDDGRFDDARWSDYRREFEKHVVVD
jgi:protoporphyrinogen oxidase